MMTLLKPDGYYTSNLNETAQVILDHLITKDDRNDDTDYHKRIWREIMEPNQTEDDREFTPAEIKNAIEELKNKKAPGEDGIMEEIYKRVFKLLPRFTYTIYSIRLQAGYFPKRWKRAKIIPIVKPGKEKVQNTFKYRLICLINVGGKDLEKLLINRVMHHLYSNNLMDPNQYGFTHKKSTTDATLAVKKYIEEGFRQGYITILISLDIRGAFDVAWWLSILTYLLTPWCRVLLEKLTGLHIVKKFPAFHGTRRFITALTSFRHLSLS